METEGRGIGHQQDQVHITGDRDRRTADPGRRIEDGVGRDLSQHGIQTGPQLAQQGRRHGFTDTGTAHEEADCTVQHRAVFQFAQFPAHGFEGFVRTDGETAAAAMAHIGEDADIAGKGGDGLEAADLAAFAALAARGQIEGRHLQPGLAAPLHLRGQEEVEVGRFHVRVHGHQGAVPDAGQRGGHAGLACPALAAGNGDTHKGSSTCWARRQRGIRPSGSVPPLPGRYRSHPGRP